MLRKNRSAPPVRATLLLPALVLVLFAAVASAQSSRVGGTLEGTVHDSSGGAIPGTEVSVRNAANNQARKVTTNEAGLFHAQELGVGVYELVAMRDGFAPYRASGVELMLGQTVRLDIVLAPASASQQLTVTAQPAAIDASQTSIVASVDRERIEELPVRTRNYLDFVLLAPGVSSAPAAPAASSIPLTGSGFVFGGLRARSNNVSIDGLDNNDEYTGSSRTELSPEIVQEFQVVTNGMSAESGGASGGSINVITRSGTNTIHGDAFIFAQDSALNARDPFESEAGKPSLRRYRAGFALGGPVTKSRTFYYAAMEQEHTRAQSGSEIAARVSAAINAVLATGAFPRLATRKITTGLFPVARAETEAAGKLDHHVMKNSALMLRYAFTNNKEAGDAFNRSALFDVSARGGSFTSDNALSGSLTTVLGSQAVGDLRVQAATRHAVLRSNDALGPEIDIAGVASFGRAYFGTSERRENHYQVEYTYARTAGKHLWKAGATVNRVSLRANVPDGFAGVYLFRTVDDFVSGQPDQFRQAFGGATVKSPVTSLGGFVQDHWSVSNDLTLELGLRYDFEHLPASFREDPTNLSPRAGLAWSPSSKWVLRLGYGIFFDRYVLANLSRAIEKNGSQAFEQVVDSSAAASLFTASGGGPLTLPARGVASSIFRPDPRMSTPYSQQASAGAEYLLATNLTVRADYQFVRGLKLPRTRNINLLPPVMLTAANAASLGISNPAPQQIGREVFPQARVNPQFNDIYQLENSARSTYNGVSFTLNRRMSDELAFSASYTVSETRDDASDFDEQPENPFNLTADYTRSRQHQRQRFVFNALWELPIGEEEENADNSARTPGRLTRAFSHIEVAPILTIGSGRPVNPLTGVDSNRSHSFPLSARPAGFARNSLQTPGLVSADFRVLKYFPFGGVRRLDVVAEFFNIFNHPNVSQVNPVFGSGGTPLRDFGKPVEIINARQIQFSLDFEF